MDARDTIAELLVMLRDADGFTGTCVTGANVLIEMLRRAGLIIVPLAKAELSGITVDDPDWYVITDDGNAALEEYQRAHGVKRQETDNG